MTYVRLPVPELHLVGVADAGIPNQERVVLRPTQELFLSGYGIAVGLPGDDGRVQPLLDSCFWFPEIRVTPPSWVLVFTGKGVPQPSEINGEEVISLHWQRPFTVFAEKTLVPVLFRVGGVTVGTLL